MFHLANKLEQIEKEAELEEIEFTEAELKTLDEEDETLEDTLRAAKDLSDSLSKK